MSKVKTGLIIFLSGLAIYLTSQLWFAKISSRNFFYSFFSQTEPHELGSEKTFAWPYRFITNYGGNRFGMLYSGMGLNLLRESCDGIIANMLKDGERLTTRELNYADVFSAPGYVFEYAFNMPLSVFSSIFGRPGFSDDLEYLTSIVFLPPDAVREVTIVWLLDESNKVMSGYSVKSSLTPVTVNPDDFYQEILYESSALSSDIPTDNNIFIARLSDDSYDYPTVSIVNPYVEKELLMGVIEQRVNVFFENPSAKYSFPGDNNVYTYIDAYTAVKYFQNDVLDYSNYRAGKEETGMLKSYSAALSFIQSDAFIVNEYYLADYKQNDTAYTFYFDYVVNNFPVFLPDEYKRSEQASGAVAIEHALEITVREGNVVNYRKIVYNFITDTLSKTAKLDFEETFPEISASQISELVLGYRLDLSKKAYLYWKIRLGDQFLSKIG